MIGPRNQFSQHLHAMKYRQRGESFDDYCVRYARTTADDKQHFRQLLECLRTQATLPAGRQQRAVGWPFQTTAFNCFFGATIPDDTRGIGDALTDSMITLRSGGGCGWCFSTLRPEGEPIRGLGDDAYASGPVSFMGMWHAMCNTIRSAGERRGAMMGVLRVDHPDIMTFIRAKQNEKALTNFNISVGVTNEFMSAVENDGLFALKFGGRVFREVRALDLWAVIMENNWDWAEPGVLFLDTINGMNPLRYCETIHGTNPCVPGETPVLTDKGHLPIKDLVGRQVNVWNGKQWSPVTPRQTGERQPLVKVELSDGSSLVCTPAHKFVLHDGSRVEARNLVPGERLTRGEWPVIDSGVDDEMAYTQGFFSGDGWFDHRGRAYIALYHGKQHLARHIVHDTIHDYAVAGGYEGHNPDYTRTYLKLDADRMLPKGWVPSCEWSVKSRLGWLAGLADADGYVTRDGCLQISSKCCNFLESVRLMLQTLGVYARVSPSRDHWRLLLSHHAVSQLHTLGFETYRLDVSAPSRWSVPQALKVKAVKWLPKRADVYCFTEPKRNMGVFGGVLCGNCGEQPLPPSGACLLLSQNLVKYLVPSYARTAAGGDGAGLNSLYRRGYEIDLDKLARDVALSVRACDNVFDKTVYPLEAQKAEAFAKRRMGVGVTGVANALEVCSLAYGCDDYVVQQGVILRTVRDAAYRTSIELARVKGSFPLFDADKWLASGFAQTLPDDIRWGIKKHGLRNGLLLSIAPTGTISLAADNVSSGIEPPPVIEQSRVVNMADGQRVVALNDYAYEEYGVRGRTAAEVAPLDHVRVQCEAQKYVDSSISKTINFKGARGTPAVDGEVSFDDFKDVYMAAFKGGAKGCTTYNMNGKRGAVITERRPPGDESGGQPSASREPAAGSNGAEAEACGFDPVTGAKVCG